MAIVKQTTSVFFQGLNIDLIKGNTIQDSSPLVQAKPELFEILEVKVEKAPKVKRVSKAQKVEKIKLEEKVVEPKEELLIEEPVAELKVTEEAPEETKEEVKETKEAPKRRKRRS